MTKVLASLFLFLVPGLTFAQTAADNLANNGTPESNMIKFVSFGVFFVALCIGFVWLVIWNDRKQKQKELKKARALAKASRA